MKPVFTLLLATALAASAWAQSPQKMSYQAVIRNSSNALVTNQSVGMRISILQGSATGTTIYVENQTPTTNANGLVSIEIGGYPGFDAINWASGMYFIKTETDPTGGTNYTITGTSQLLSVPYALYANTAKNGFSGKYTDLVNKPTFTDSISKYSVLLTGNQTIAGNKTFNSDVTINGITVGLGKSSKYTNTANGIDALYYNTTGGGNTANGNDALYYNTTGNNNTAIGSSAGPAYSYSNLNNTTALGDNTVVTNSNTVMLGNSSVTSIGGYAAWSNFSDGRFKTNVQTNVPGLAFIAKLRPVTFKWDLHKLDTYRGVNDSIIRKSPEMEQARLAREKKTYTGFIAQEVEQAATDCGFDFSGIVKPENDKTPYNLSYAEFVVPLVKAVQELNDQNKELAAQNKALKDDVAALKAAVEKLQSK